MLLDYQAPSSVHTKFTAASGSTTERIQVGSKGWMKVGSTWQPVPAIDVSTIISGAGGLTDQVKLSNTVLVGPDTIDGTATTRYAYTADLGGLGTSTGTMWIRNADCLPVKQDATSSVTLSGSTVVAHVVVLITNYGGITVTAPA